MRLACLSRQTWRLGETGGSHAARMLRLRSLGAERRMAVHQYRRRSLRPGRQPLLDRQWASAQDRRAGRLGHHSPAGRSLKRRPRIRPPCADSARLRAAIAADVHSFRARPASRRRNCAASSTASLRTSAECWPSLICCDQIEIAPQHRVEPPAAPAALHIADKRRWALAIAAHHSSGQAGLLEGVLER